MALDDQRRIFDEPASWTGRVKRARLVLIAGALVFLALAFWTWLWGPIGSFLAAPLSIVGLVVFNHLFPHDDAKLPD